MKLTEALQLWLDEANLAYDVQEAYSIRRYTDERGEEQGIFLMPGIYCRCDFRSPAYLAAIRDQTVITFGIKHDIVDQYLHPSDPDFFAKLERGLKHARNTFCRSLGHPTGLDVDTSPKTSV